METFEINVKKIPEHNQTLAIHLLLDKIEHQT